jgi:DNA-binding transcriptional MerR regulator
MRISEVAALAGVPTATVRYYERRGLIAPTPRTASGYRQYGTEAARRLRFIKHAQALGFSLEEIQDLLALRASDPAACARVEATTRAKIRAVRERLAELRRLERELQALAGSCATTRTTEPCPVLTILSDERTDRRARTTA